MLPDGSKYEALRVDPANWKLGVVYYCPEDPRVIVRQRLPLGWTWNFGHSWVIPAIVLTVLVFLSPPVIAWWLGVRSPIALSIVVAAALGLIIALSSRLSQPPKT